MFSKRALAVGTAVSCLASSASAFNAQSRSNVAVYYVWSLWLVARCVWMPVLTSLLGPRV